MTRTDTDTAAARRPSTRCATCGATFDAARSSHVHCSADCRRLAARLSGLRDLADDIVASHPSATRRRAVFALRANLTAAASGDALVDVKVKADRHADGTDRARRWCACCRAELPVGGRGRPAVSCKASTGRRCARWRNRAQEVADLVASIVDGRDDATRARVLILRTVAEINAEIGL